MLRIGHRLAAVAVAGAVCAAAPAMAGDDAGNWHPAVAAYRTMVFLADLKPVAWSRIVEAYDEIPTGSTRAAEDYFAALPAAAGTKPVDAIEAAIAGKDREALYESATRAMSQLVRQALDDAQAALANPSAARQNVLEARELYRAFDDYIAEVDPEASERLDYAWLNLTKSVAVHAVLGRNVVLADRGRFADAKKKIAAYLVANYEPKAFTPRKSFAPLPESVVATRGEVAVAPRLPPGSNTGEQQPLPRVFLNFEERGIDERDLPMVAYGDMLFDSPEIFGEPARSLGISCSSCHNRSDINQDFNIPGVSRQAGSVDVDGSFFNPLFNDHRDDSLDIPSLRGLRFTGPYGRDGRFASLRDFTRNVIVNEFAGAEPTAFMLDALTAYMLEFDFLPNSKLDAEGRLTGKASEAAHRGEALFRKPFAQMDGQSCATCHIPSGNFLDRKAHTIGSQVEGYGGARDSAFDTPTLLAARFTAPYFHDGSLPTLASVVEWFNDRYRLGLSEAERADLTAYVEAVGDADTPYQTFDATNTHFRLDWKELTTFTTVLDTLLPKRDAFHARLLIETVGPKLAEDAGEMVNTGARSEVYKLSDMLAGAGRAVDEADWAAAERQWAAFKKLAAEVAPDMR
jgi:cytochrome c peroxidase